MKKEFLIKILNKYMDNIGNDYFVEEYGVDRDNLPLKIFVEDIDKDSSGRLRMFVSATPEKMSHTLDYLDYEHDEYLPISYEDAVIETIIQALTTFGLGSSWNKFKYIVNQTPVNQGENVVYIDEQKNKSTKVRTFDENIHENELKWHRDEKDRRVKILECNGWMLQLDNELPVELKEGKEYFIPKEMFHRTIKGKGKLVIEIKELD